MAVAPVPGYENGFFLGGSLFDHVSPTMKIYREEIFGPVLVVVRVPTLKAAIDWSTRTNTPMAPRCSRATVARRAPSFRASRWAWWGQCSDSGADGLFSFGGWRRSSFTDHAMHGMEGVRFYTRLKTVTSRWPPLRGQFFKEKVGRRQR